MIELITFSLTLYIKYILLFTYFLLLGRSFFILVNKFMLKEKDTDNLIFDTKVTIVYPIVGLIIFGNLSFFYLVLDLNQKYLFFVHLVIFCLR